VTDESFETVGGSAMDCNKQKALYFLVMKEETFDI
jgi:hypothetical protein